MKKVMLGNEAIARGAYEAGCLVGAAYPGTPSTEIMKNMATYKEIQAEWSVNEKVAAEVAIGASMAGARSMASMKHFGFNVATDAIFPSVYHGVTGGLVYICADDPGMNSSGTEPDSRHYGVHMKMPVLEPADSQECLDYVKKAFYLSEEFDTPIMIRTTTRVNHGSGIVELGERDEVGVKVYEKNILKNTNIPGIAKGKHDAVEKRLLKVQEFSNNCEFNRIEMNTDKLGIVCNGISYQYAKEVFGNDASYLKIGLSYPMPDGLIREFASKVETIYVIEELDPYMEEHIKALGINCIGKEKLPLTMEFTADIVRKAFGIESDEEGYTIDVETPIRPASFCAGCPHRGIYYEVSKYAGKIVATGDIGCYALNIHPPFSVNHTQICMGGSITAGTGFERVERVAERGYKIFSFIGDSTFFHSGMTGLVNAVYNKANTSIFILDNSTTAMTGHQDNPSTGKTLMKEVTEVVDVKKVVEGCGVHPDHIRVVDPYDLTATAEVVKEAYEAEGVFVVIVKQACALLKPVIAARKGQHCKVNADKCKGCKLCITKLSCPSLMVQPDGKVAIEAEDCNGCTICKQVCPFDAIEKEGK